MESLARVVAAIAMVVLLLGPSAAVASYFGMHGVGGVLGVLAVVAGLWWVNVTRGTAAMFSIMPVSLGVWAVARMFKAWL